jgi:hypothetical protein
LGEGGSVVTNHRRTGEDLDNDTRTSHAVQLTGEGAKRVPRFAGPAESADAADPERDRRLRRARFLAELAEARELRKRVTPRRTRAAELHARVLRTFRY